MNGKPHRTFFDLALAGDIAGAGQLLDKHPDLARARDGSGQTALHIAAEHNDRDLADLLISRGAALHEKAPWGHDPLTWAANCGAADVADLLLSGGAGPLTLWAAAGLGKLDVVRSYWADQSTLASNVVHTRSQRADDGHWTESELITDYNTIVSDAFYIASRNGHVETAAWLLEKGADPNSRGFFDGTALHWAAINGHENMISFLLAQGADPTLLDAEFEATPAGWAKEGGHPQIERMLSNQS